MPITLAPLTNLLPNALPASLTTAPLAHKMLPAAPVALAGIDPPANLAAASDKATGAAGSDTVDQRGGAGTCLAQLASVRRVGPRSNCHVRRIRPDLFERGRRARQVRRACHRQFPAQRVCLDDRIRLSDGR
jgi:hypothetical protein